MTAWSLAVSLPRFFWRNTSRLNWVVGITSSGGGGGGGSEALGLATSNTQVLEHLFQALEMEQVLALPGLPEDLGRLGVGNVPLGVARALGALGVRCTALRGRTLDFGVRHL